MHAQPASHVLRRSRSLLLLVAALLVAGCGGTMNAPEFSITLAGIGPGHDVPVRLVDRAGIVSAVLPYEPQAGELPVEVTNPHGDLRRLAVKWLGLDCDRAVLVTVEQSAEGIVRLQIRVERPTDCLLAGVGRAVLLELTTPVPAGRVLFEVAAS